MLNNMRNSYLSLIILIVFFALSIEARVRENKADYLIIENVDQLLVYNKYQQRITQEEKSLFVPFIPMRVIESQSTLNDNYTPCMKVELRGYVFYLIKNNKTTLLGAGKLGYNRLFKNVPVLDDTVQIIAENGAIFISPDYLQRKSLHKGQALARFFNDGNLAYTGLLGAALKYGWVNLTKDDEYITWQKKTPGSASSYVIPDQALKRIDIKLKEVNSSLVRLFDYFNKQANQKKIIPQWRYELSKRGFACVLEPNSYAQYYTESNQYLKRELDNILLGANFTVLFTPGRIQIQGK